MIFSMNPKAQKEFEFYSALYSVACQRIDSILAQANGYASQEALNSSFFGRFFVAIADTFTGLCNTFLANIGGIAKSIKRSELREFVESNRLKTSTISKIPFEKLADFQIDVPANLKVTYLVAVNQLLDIYNKLNALDVARNLSTSVTEIFKGIAANDSKVAAKIRESATVIQSGMKDAKLAVTECQKNFNGRFEIKKAFKTVFKSVEEFTQCTDLLVGAEPRLQAVATIKEAIEKTSETLGGIVRIAQKTDLAISVQDLNVFGEMIKNVSLIFDSYKLAVTRQLALEHNHVLNYNNIYAKVR